MRRPRVRFTRTPAVADNRKARRSCPATDSSAPTPDAVRAGHVQRRPGRPADRRRPRGGIVRVTDHGDDQRPGPGVVHTWSARDPAGWREAAAALNAYDVAIVQHEYGIYPGTDGEEVLPLLRRLTRAEHRGSAHRAAASPPTRQKSLLEQIVATAGRGRHDDRHRPRPAARRLRRATRRKVDGHPARRGRARRLYPSTGRTRPHLLTWGLLGPGKGIEWSLRALARLQDLDRLRLHGGGADPPEGARARTVRRTGRGCTSSAPSWASRTPWTTRPSTTSRRRCGRADPLADVVVLPYDSREQVTSGVLIEAVAAGRARRRDGVPARRGAADRWAGSGRTPSEPGGTGQGDPAGPDRTGPDRPVCRAGSSAAAHLRWPAVAARYGTLAEELVDARSPAVTAVPA